MTRACQRREVVAVMVERGISKRRACVLATISDSSLRYTARPRNQAAVLDEIQRLAHRYPRYGYRRVWAILRRTHSTINHKRVYRLWQYAGLQVPRRRKRTRSVSTTTLPCQAVQPGHVWTYDFVHDRCANGTTLKMLTLVDEFTRESLAIDVATSLNARAVQQVLRVVFARAGVPQYLRSDNGPEFIATALQVWLKQHGLHTIHIEPGQPWQNGVGESFNGKFRDECLNMQWFRSLAEAKVQIERWRRQYNTERPHSSLGYQTPQAFAANWTAQHHVESLT